jgi:hypothetical protein
MSLLDSKIQSTKNGTNPTFLDLSHEVNLMGLEPQISMDINELWN